jgi:hypothetical protein
MTTNTVYHVACVGKEVAVDLRSKPKKKKKKAVERKIKKETKMRQRKAYKDKGDAASLLHGLNTSVFSAERF